MKKRKHVPARREVAQMPKYRAYITYFLPDSMDVEAEDEDETPDIAWEG